MQPLTPTQLAAQNPKFLGIAQDYFRPLIASSVLDDFCLAIAAFVSYAHEDCLLWNPLHDLAAKGGLKHPLNHLQTLQKSEAFLGLLTPDLLHLTSKLKPAMDATDAALANLKDFTKTLPSTTCQVDTHRVTLDSHKQTGVQQMQAIQMTGTDGHVEIYTQQNYLGYGEWVHSLTLEGCPIIADSGNKYELINLDSPKQTEEKPMPATTTIATPEVLAANDVKVLDVIEDFLLDYQYDVTLTDDLVFAIQAYMQDERANKAALALIADNSKLEGVFKIVQKIRNSDAFQELVAENTPDELPKAEPKPQVVAVATTAKAVASSKPAKATKAPKQPKEAKAPKATKAKPVTPMPVIASVEALEAMTRPELAKAIQALNCNISTSTRGNSATKMMVETLAFHVLGLKDYKFPAKQKPAKAPKTPKAKKQEPVIALPEGLSWDECKNMKYRQLQQVCKALRSQGLFQGNIGGKGATSENLLKGCADYFRSQGVDIQEVTYTPQSTKELHLPNFAKIVEDKRLERVASETLRMDAQGDTMGAWVHAQANAVAA